MISLSKKIISLLLVISVILTLFCSVSISAEEPPANGAVAEVSTGNEYTDYLTAKKDIPYAENSVTISDEETTLDGKQVYTVNVANDGLFNIEFNYRLAIEKELKLSVMIDGALPFAQAESIYLPQIWENDGKVQEDKNGNHILPAQIVSDEFFAYTLFDKNGETEFPYLFYLSKGTHTIEFDFKNEVNIKSITLKAPTKLLSYKEIEKLYKEKGYKKYTGEPINIEAEDATYKSDRSLIGLSDTESSDITPNSYKYSYINHIGSTNWQTPSDEIIWNINAPEDGLYSIGMRYKQDKLINGYSYRKLKIDGEIPFSEAMNLKFFYDNSWQNCILGDGEEVYYFYLTKGTHTISLTVAMGETSEYFGKLKKIVDRIGNLYLDIVMITGETPDSGRNYDLFNQIPDFNNILKTNYDELMGLASAMEELSGKRTGQYVGALKNMARVLKSMLDNPYVAQDFVPDYYTQYTNLSSWLYEMKKMPLSIDAFEIAGDSKDITLNNKSFFTSFLFTIKRFIASFSDEYAKAGSSSKSGKSLKIWVNWGRDQTQVLNNLIQSSFVPYSEKALGYQVDVNLQITTASLIDGILSGNFPDLSLHMARTAPINFAMRGALYDLKNFDDLDEVLKRFVKDSEVPYIYDDGLYALPDTQSFYIMFYRSDILESLGIKVPTTWDEFLEATAIIQRNNMQSYLPASALVNNTGLGACGLYSSLLMQNGVDIYNNNKDAVVFDAPQAIEIFSYWTDMYTQYKIPTTQSFYNRFRVGLCPLGIDVYTQYTMLKDAAPEIDGRWGIALIPGTVKEDGTIDHSVSGMGTGCSILSKSSNKKEAWEFLKWWTSSETQLDYNNNIESILGSISRVTTANTDALEKMTWDEADLDIIVKQRDNTKELYEIPGGYYITRAVDQAYWAVVNNTVDNAKDAMVQWNEIANREIARKIKEYSKKEVK